MHYFFILGTNPTLSIAELAAVLKINRPLLISPDCLLAEMPEFDPPQLIKRLGGTIKIGVIDRIIPLKDEGTLINELFALSLKIHATSAAGKFNFGISGYGPIPFNKKNLGIQLKQLFKNRGISSRFVVSQEKTLSSVVITQNKLLSKGVEIFLAKHAGQIFIGRTAAVQAFKDMSLRDFGRPVRDDLSGMIPPKLAQIMINLGQKEPEKSVFLDPFCGSGTILMEALLMGYKEIYGSDISPVAIKATKSNLSWISELYKTDPSGIKIAEQDVRCIASKIDKKSFDLIVTEPYLGPQRGKLDFKQVISELESLYSTALKELRKLLKDEGRVVMVWPSFYGEKPINPNYAGFKIANPIPVTLKFPTLKLSRRNTIIYGRPGQKVFREIVILEKN